MQSKRCIVMIVFLSLVSSAVAQERRKVAVVADPKVSRERLDAETKLADILLSKFAENPALQPIDRSQNQALMDEMSLKASPWYKASDFAKIGNLKGVSVLAMVTVSDLAGGALQQQQFTGVTVSGTIHLSVSVKALTVETADVLSAPTATIDKKEVFKQYRFSTPPPGDPSKMYGAESEKLLADALADAAEQIYPKLAKSLPVEVATPVSYGMVAGMLDGKVLITRGSKDGFKLGDRFQVLRTYDTKIVNPEKPSETIIRKKTICELTLSEVDDTSSTGTCKGSNPNDVAQKGDLLQPEAEK